MRLPFDHFDVIARWYDRVLGSPDAGADLAHHLPLAPGRRLVDVGGGTGRVAEILAKRGATVIVCDRSRPMLQQAQAKGLPAVQASTDRLPFRSGSADGVYVVDAFHHFTEPSPAVMQPAAAAELWRLVAPAGCLVIQEPDIRQWGVKLVALAERMLLMGSRFLTPAQLATLLTRAGTGPVTTAEAGFSFAAIATKPPEPT